MLINFKNEVSIYLQMHDSDLINWYPWEKGSFEMAKREEKPIFLSVGYIGSTLCRRMEESFNDKVIAKLLNESFICIKVDKDERSDIDKYYKQIYKLMNREESSYPISVFMSGDLEPFYATGYIPKEPKMDMLGFQELLITIRDKYSSDREILKEKGREVLSHINSKKSKIEATKLNREIFLTLLKKHIETLFDKEYGGFGDIPKFPQSSVLDLMLEFAKATGDKDIYDKYLFTLQKMGSGEIFESSKGGFFKYSNGKDWSSPKREKSLYENAHIIYLYIEAYKLTRDDFYKNIAIKSVRFLMEEMSDGTLFYSYLVKKDLLDKKIVTSFNSMMITTLFHLSPIESRYNRVAQRALDKLLENRYINGKLYHMEGIEGFLEDYAHLGIALFTAYQFTENGEYLIISQTLLNRAIDKFYEYGLWKFANGDIVVYDDIYDITYPSSLATILYLIELLSPLVEGDYTHILLKTLEVNSYSLMRQPLSTPKMSKVLLKYFL